MPENFPPSILSAWAFLPPRPRADGSCTAFCFRGAVYVLLSDGRTPSSTPSASPRTQTEWFLRSPLPPLSWRLIGFKHRLNCCFSNMNIQRTDIEPLDTVHSTLSPGRSGVTRAVTSTPFPHATHPLTRLRGSKHSHFYLLVWPSTRACRLHARGCLSTVMYVSSPYLSQHL